MGKNTTAFVITNRKHFEELARKRKGESEAILGAQRWEANFSEGLLFGWKIANEKEIKKRRKITSWWKNKRGWCWKLKHVFYLFFCVLIHTRLSPEKTSLSMDLFHPLFWAWRYCLEVGSLFEVRLYLFTLRLEMLALACLLCLTFSGANVAGMWSEWTLCI